MMNDHYSIKRYKIIATAHVIFVNDLHEILLQKRCNTGYEDGNYSFVGGHVEENETLKQAAIREVREETGLSLNEQALTLSQVMHRKKEDPDDQDRIDFFFLTHYNGNLRIAEPGKSDELGWFSRSSLPENIVPYIRSYINHPDEIYNEFGWNKV